jgi:MFS family permease
MWKFGPHFQISKFPIEFGLVRVVPVVVFSLLSGVAADVYDRRKLMLVTQSVMAIFAAALAAITWRGPDSVWPVYGIAAAGFIEPRCDSG